MRRRRKQLKQVVTRDIVKWKFVNNNQFELILGSNSIGRQRYGGIHFVTTPTWCQATAGKTPGRTSIRGYNTMLFEYSIAGI